MRASDVMTEAPVYCDESATLEDAVRLMWSHDVASVPVVDANDHVIGIVTARDVCLMALNLGRVLEEIPVGMAMSQPVMCCHADDPLCEVEGRMKWAKVRRLPVVGTSDRLVGMITLGDLARRAANPSSDREGETITPDEVAATLSAIAQRHELRARARA
jgi:CBS-domain-containing membrane protein